MEKRPKNRCQKLPKNHKDYARDYNINVHFDSYPNKKEDGRVKVSIVVNLGGRKEYYVIQPKAFMYRKFWREAVDPRTGEKLGHKFIQSTGNPDYEKVFPLILAAKAQMEGLISRILKKKGVLSHTVLKRRWNRQSDTFHAYISEYAKGKKGKVQETTVERIESLAKLVKLYDEAVMVSEITWEWLSSFESWCLNDAYNPITRETGRNPTTVAGYMVRLGTVLRRAKRTDVIEEDPYHEYKDLEDRVSQPDYIPNPLTIDDVMRLHEVFETRELLTMFPHTVQGRRETKGERLHRYLQMVLVSIYTGARYSDFRKYFNPKEYSIVSSPKGQRLHFRMQKSKRGHAVYVTDRLRSVMADAENGIILKGKAPANSTVGENFRLILRELGMDDQHKWHYLRKTFANLVRELSEDDWGASKALGHKSMAVSTKHYFNRTNPQADKAVAALDKLGDNGPELPPPPDMLYEIQLLKMLNPGLKLTPKIKQWLEQLEGAEVGKDDSVVVPFGVAN